MAKTDYKVVYVETELGNVEMQNQLLEQADKKTHAKWEPKEEAFARAEYINTCNGFVFLMFTLQMFAISCVLWIIEGSSSGEEGPGVSAAFLVPAGAYLCLSTIVTITTSSCYDKFPFNLVILAIELSGLSVILVAQILNFGLERSKLSDIPAVRFALLCCILISAVSFMTPKIIPFVNAGSMLRMAIALTTMLITLTGYRLYREFRFFPLLLLFVALFYVIWRAEHLGDEQWRKHFDEMDGDISLSEMFRTAIYIALQVLYGPLVIFSGLLFMSFTLLRPRHPWA